MRNQRGLIDEVDFYVEYMQILRVDGKVRLEGFVNDCRRIAILGEALQPQDDYCDWRRIDPRVLKAPERSDDGERVVWKLEIVAVVGTLVKSLWWDFNDNVIRSSLKLT